MLVLAGFGLIVRMGLYDVSCRYTYSALRVVQGAGPIGT
jgi:hypothetical protein